MIAWRRANTTTDLVVYEAEVGVLLLTVEPSTDSPTAWCWSVGTIGGDGAEFGGGSASDKYCAKKCARNRVKSLVAEIERVLHSRRRA